MLWAPPRAEGLGAIASGQAWVRRKECRRVPETLREALQEGVLPGERPSPPAGSESCVAHG